MLDLSPLRSGAFRHLALGYWVNEFGNWIGEIALTVLVYDRTGSPLGTAALFLALRFGPAVFAPLLTARIETFTPRAVLATTYALEAGLFAGLAVLTHHFSMSGVLALSMLDGILAISAKALTRSATAAGLREQRLLREGNGILNLGLMSSTACAPMIAGALVAWKGPRSALLIDAGTFLLTALIICTAVGLQVEHDAAATFTGRLRKGANTIRERVALRRLIGAVALGMLLSAIPLPIEVVFAKHVLHAGDLGYGLMLGAWGAGMVLGAAAFTLLSSVRLTTIVGVGALVIAVGYGGLAAAPSLVVACVASAVGGTGNGAGWIAAVTAVQERIPLDAQTAVMTLLEGLNQLMPAVGFIIGGILTAVASPRLAYAAAAVGVILVLLAASVRPIDRVILRDWSSDGRDYDPKGREAVPQDPGSGSRTTPLPAVAAR
ncbi:MAG: MFS transporter [Solirubrobacteraceae bacterium]